MKSWRGINLCCSLKICVTGETRHREGYLHSLCHNRDRTGFSISSTFYPHYWSSPYIDCGKCVGTKWDGGRGEESLAPGNDLRLLMFWFHSQILGERSAWISDLWSLGWLWIHSPMLQVQSWCQTSLDSQVNHKCDNVIQSCKFICFSSFKYLVQLNLQQYC